MDTVASSTSNFYLAPLPFDIQKIIVGYVNIYTVGALLITNKTNLASNILLHSKIINVEASKAALLATVDERDQYLSTMLKTLLKYKATPEVLKIHGYIWKGFPDDCRDEIRRLAPHLRVAHVTNVTDRDLAWLDELEWSHVRDLKISFASSWDFDDYIPPNTNVLKRISPHHFVALQSLYVTLAADHGPESTLALLATTKFPCLEHLIIDGIYYALFKDSMSSWFSQSPEERIQLRPNLRSISLFLGTRTVFSKADFITRFLLIDPCGDSDQLESSIRCVYGAGLAGFLIEGVSLWSRIIMNRWRDCGDPELDKIFDRCYPQLGEHNATETEVRQRLSHLCNTVEWARVILSNKKKQNVDHIKPMIRLLKKKFDRLAEPMSWVATSPEHDARTDDRSLQYPAESFHASIVQCADLHGEESLGRKSWTKLKKLYENRAQSLSILSEVPSPLYYRFLAEPVEWLSQFNLHECIPARCVGAFNRGGLWRHINNEALQKLLLCPNFDPNVDAADGEIMLQIFDSNPGSFSPTAHLALQRCIPRLDPAKASSLWFSREEIFSGEPETSRVVFEFILENWKVFNPHVRLFNSIESFSKFQEYVLKTKKKSVPPQVALQVANGMWRNLFSTAKDENAFRVQAESLLREIPVVPNFVKEIRAGKQVASIIPRIGDDAATRVLKEISRANSQSCIVS